MGASSFDFTVNPEQKAALVNALSPRYAAREQEVSDYESEPDVRKILAHWEELKSEAKRLQKEVQNAARIRPETEPSMFDTGVNVESIAEMVDTDKISLKG